MCEPTIAYKALDGTLHATCELAQERDRFNALYEFIRDKYDLDVAYRHHTALFAIAKEFLICKINP